MRRYEAEYRLDPRELTQSAVRHEPTRNSPTTFANIDGTPAMKDAA